MIELTHQPIDLAAVSRVAPRDECGAVLVFAGTVRSLTGGRETVRIDYEAYEPMAVNVLKQIEDEARLRWPVGEVTIQHRLGTLEVGEVSVAIAVSCPHRADAFDACRFVIERIKQSVPIWKQEYFADGTCTWVHPDPRTTRKENTSSR